MELGKVIKDLKDMRNAGFIDCNIQCFLDQLEKVTESVVVDKFIADWYEKHKNNLEFNMWDYVYRFDYQEDTSFKEWFNDPKTEPFKTLVNMKQFGYKVEEKLYLVRVKGVKAGEDYLNYDSRNKKWYFDNCINSDSIKTYHTQEELEKAGFGWMLNSPGVEVTEVEEG